MTTINTNSYANFRAFEDSLVCVKAMVFKKGKEAATVLCCVPEENVGNVHLVKNILGSECPSSYGTFIRVIGRGLMVPHSLTSLTSYERYLKENGWEFCFVVKTANRKKKSKAFSIVKECIDVLRRIKKF